jgi:hypothetical protein
MAYDSRVYRVLIASPSDVEEEREIAVRVIQEWNDLYSSSRKVVLLPLRWETHTAPEYGTRPQEVINRAIVDECDLLLGIFWTRIGSPTGVADSGTLEEITRVGEAEKPIMLYFSRIGIDPDKIDLDQIDRLKKFKELSYPKGLIENYKSVIEFRDKLSKQIELKVRDLQKSDASGKAPLSLRFLSLETGSPSGRAINYSYTHYHVSTFEGVPKTKIEEAKDLAAKVVRREAWLPIALTIENESPLSIRNLYVELDLSSSSGAVEITDRPHRGFSYNFDSKIIQLMGGYSDYLDSGENLEQLQRSIERFEADKLQKTDLGWRLSFEWEALQPQRVRLIKPVLYAYSPESSKISISAKVFTDSLPEPNKLSAEIDIDVIREGKSFAEVVPKWRDVLKVTDSVDSVKKAVKKL